MEEKEGEGEIDLWCGDRSITSHLPEFCTSFK